MGSRTGTGNTSTNQKMPKDVIIQFVVSTMDLY